MSFYFANGSRNIKIKIKKDPFTTIQRFLGMTA